MTTIKPILKYPGAKWRISTWLHSFTPVMPRVVDVFGGSGAFLLTLPYTPKHLIYNDLSGELRNLFSVLRHAEQRVALCEAVTFTLWSRAEYLSVVGPNGITILTGEPVEDARRYLVATWQACKTNTSTRNGWRNMGAKNTTMESSTWHVWRQLPERLQLAGQCLQSAEIESLPALALIGRYNTPETLIYADPPYLRTNVHSTRRRLYRHEMTDADHIELISAAEAHTGPFMLSGYDSPLYRERLQHWRLHTIDARAEGNVPRTECLWLNPRCVELLGYGPLFDLPAVPQAPAALASRLAAVGCELHHDPQTSRYGYHTEWRLEGLEHGPALFGTLEAVADWLKRVEPAQELEEVAA
jgi:DNA adenine methylase